MIPVNTGTDGIWQHVGFDYYLYNLLCKTRTVIGLELSSIRVYAVQTRTNDVTNGGKTRAPCSNTNPSHRHLKTEKYFHQTGNIP